MHSKIGLAIGVGVLAVALTACSSATPSSSSSSGSSGNTSSAADGVTATSVSLGTISDESGPTTGIQLPWLHGVTSVVKAANKAGGVHGRTINLLSEDDKYDVTVGVPAFKKLATQTPAVAILGVNTSNVQDAVTPLVAAAKVPLITGQATTKNTLIPLNKYVFGLAPTYADQADVMIAYAKKKLGKSKIKIAVVENGGASGVEVDGLFKERAKDGVTDVGTVILPATSTTADAQVQQLIALKPDFIMFHGSSVGVNLFGKSQAKFGSKLPLIGIAPSGGPSAFLGLDPAVGNLYEYVQWTTPSPIKSAGLAQMNKDAKAAGYATETNNPDFVAGYVAGKLFTAALDKAGAKLTRASLDTALESIKSLDTGGLAGPIGYSATDHAGATALVPLKWDYKTNSFLQDGTFAEYAKVITGEYAKQ
jgi:branched-chain amino acid transport system substrate-binding protein